MCILTLKLVCIHPRLNNLFVDNCKLADYEGKAEINKSNQIELPVPSLEPRSKLNRFCFFYFKNV